MLYIKPRGTLPEFTALHKSAIEHIPEFEFAKPYVKCDADFRSLCSQGFAKAFYEANPNCFEKTKVRGLFFFLVKLAHT